MESRVSRHIPVLPVAGGWLNVVSQCVGEHAGELGRNPLRHVLLLLDFDEGGDRLKWVREQIPTNVAERVFVLECWSEPERLKQKLGGTLEGIGQALAEECRSGTGNVWADGQLARNAGELARLRAQVRPFLF